MSKYIWFALCGCVYINYHEDFLTVYYISVLMYCMCQLLHLCGRYCEILYQGLLVCGHLHVYKVPVPMIGPLVIDFFTCVIKEVISYAGVMVVYAVKYVSV